MIKKGEYAAVGVREYYILHQDPERLAFYTGDPSGLYVPIPPQAGVIHSQVFPGFRFRRTDLQRRPSTAELRADPVYADFIHPEWREAEAIAEQTRAIAEQAQRQREAAEARADQERRLRQAAEARSDQERRQRQHECQRREAAEARVEQERQQRQAAEARLAQVEALLAQRRGQ